MKLTVRVQLPAHLRLLAAVPGEIQLALEAPATQRTLFDALEAQYPMLQGTVRDHVTKTRRPFLRFFASEQDISHHAPDKELPASITRGEEPLLIVGAISGG